jgi:hypothetical protein
VLDNLTFIRVFFIGFELCTHHENIKVLGIRGVSNHWARLSKDMSQSALDKINKLHCNVGLSVYPRLIQKSVFGAN